MGTAVFGECVLRSLGVPAQPSSLYGHNSSSARAAWLGGCVPTLAAGRAKFQNPSWPAALSDVRPLLQRRRQVEHPPALHGRLFRCGPASDHRGRLQGPFPQTPLSPTTTTHPPQRVYAPRAVASAALFSRGFLLRISAAVAAFELGWGGTGSGEVLPQHPSASCCCSHVPSRSCRWNLPRPEPGTLSGAVSEVWSVSLVSSLACCVESVHPAPAIPSHARLRERGKRGEFPGECESNGRTCSRRFDLGVRGFLKENNPPHLLGGSFLSEKQPGLYRLATRTGPYNYLYTVYMYFTPYFQLNGRAARIGAGHDV